MTSDLQTPHALLRGFHPFEKVVLREDFYSYPLHGALGSQLTVCEEVAERLLKCVSKNSDKRQVGGTQKERGASQIWKARDTRKEP